VNQELEDLPFCKCGCGERVTKKGNVWIHNHHPHPKKPKPKPQLCECGCGEYASPGCKFISGHNSRINHGMKGKKHSQESLEKMSLSHIILYKDEKERDKISKTVIKLWKDIEYRERVINARKDYYSQMDDPGQEMVTHHYIYDFNDLNKYTIEVTRSEHLTIHNNLRWSGLEVPCINIMKEKQDES